MFNHTVTFFKPNYKELSYDGEKNIQIGVVGVSVPPQVRTVFSQLKEFDAPTIIPGKGIPLFLQFPYAHFFVYYWDKFINLNNQEIIPSKYTNFYTIGVTFSEQPLANSNDITARLPLSNGEFAFCLGNHDKTFQSVPEMVKYIIGHFWNSPFEQIYSQATWLNITQNKTSLKPLLIYSQELYNLVNLSPNEPALNTTLENLNV